jgi:hypothetical protein
MINQLPSVSKFSSISNAGNILCIVSEGFEQRSLSFILKSGVINIKDIIICKYSPIRTESKYNELYNYIKRIHPNIENIDTIVFDRFEPSRFENAIENRFENINKYEELIIDISVMSKLLIMQLMCSLLKYQGRIRIIYAEACDYTPTEKEYNMSNQISVAFPSFGVHDIVRTPLLSNIVMQKSPLLLVTFLSFNEQLIRALLSDYDPPQLILIGSVPPSLHWREKAVVDIHRTIIDKYSGDNPLDDCGLLVRKVSTLYYQETVSILADIYQKHCITKRIVLAPTGTKMQTIGCSIIKLCCPDIHIEYPTPESYYISGYSSSEIKDIHEIVFENFALLLKSISDYYDFDRKKGLE